VFSEVEDAAVEKEVEVEVEGGGGRWAA